MRSSSRDASVVSLLRRRQPFVTALLAALLLFCAPVARATVTSSVNAGVLTAQSDADDAIAITVVAGNVKVNGSDPDNGPTTTFVINRIDVLGGPGANTLDTSGVQASDFLNLSLLNVQGGGGDDTLIGGPLLEHFDGGAGADTMMGGGGDDELLGGDDNDTIVWNPGDGADLIDGGAGDDTLTIAGSPIDGDQFSFDRFGNFYRTTLLGAQGATILASAIENYTIDGGGGNDTILLDNLSVGALTAVQLTLLGGAGTDTLDARLHPGGPPAITLRGGADNDTLWGSGGADILMGEGGNDMLNGGDGGDTLNGGAGDDTLNGGDGGDTLVGGPGTDIVNGDGGDDQFIWNDGDGSDTWDGGLGLNVATMNGSPSDVDDVTLQSDGSDFQFFDALPSGGVTVDFRGVTTVTLNSLGGNDFIVVRNLVGGNGLANVVVNAGDGNDVIDLTGTPVGFSLTVDGGAGHDEIHGSPGADALHGGDDDDFLEGGGGPDMLFGDAGNDELFWTDPWGSVQVDGGSGTDTFSVATAELFFPAVDDFVISVSGTTLVVARTTPTAATLTIVGTETLSINSGGLDDTIIVNSLTGVADLTTVVLDGGSGNDNLDAAFLGANVVQLTLNGGAGNDTILGSTGVDTINGGDGDDDLNGGPSADTINGGPGNDSLRGGPGVDTIDGGDDDDLVIWFPGELADINLGGAGDDTLQANGTPFGDLASVGRDGQAVRVFVGASSVRGTQFEHLVVLGLDGDDNLRFEQDFEAVPGLLAVTLDGGDGSDSISAIDAGTSVDAVTLLGGPGNDNIRGSLNNDFIDGGPGDDSLDGKGGDDPIMGGPGNDVIAWVSGSGSDAVDGGDGIDTLEFKGIVSADSFVISANGAGVRLSSLVPVGENVEFVAGERLVVYADAADDSVVFESLAGIIPLVEVIVEGGDGNDILDASALSPGVIGTLTVNGGGGNDLLRVGGTGTILVDTGLDDDTVEWTAAGASVMVQGTGGTNILVVYGSDIAGPPGDSVTLRNAAGIPTVDYARDTTSGTLEFMGFQSVGIDTRGGDDTVHVADVSGVAGLTGILVVGGAGTQDALIVDGSALNDTIFLTGSVLTLPSYSVTLSTIEDLTIDAGDGDDVLTARALAGTRVTVDGGGQSTADTLKFQTGGLTFSHTPIDDTSGTFDVTGRLLFTYGDIENLIVDIGIIDASGWLMR